jgi:hypothetical protein
VGAAELFAAAVLALPGAVNATSPDFATIAAAPNRAGARPVLLTISIHTLLQCGRLGARKIVVDLPTRARVPDVVPASAVLVGNAHPRAVIVRGHTITIVQRKPPGVICASLTFGAQKVLVKRTAGIGNPPTSGRYTFVVRLAAHVLRAVLRVP